MISPAQNRCIQILVTNKCEHKCADCSEFVSHIPEEKQFYISLGVFEKALQSLEDFNAQIGIFGGNPLLHPLFATMMEIYKKHVYLKCRREIWCSKGGKLWDRYESVLKDVFYPELITYNEHTDQYACYHQPVHIAADEVFDGNVTGNPGADIQLMWKLIDNCWVQQRWSSIISPLGAYPCEVMAARAMVLGKPAGLPIDKGWWKRPITDWQYQINQLCPKCSMCLPVPEKMRDNEDFDTVSPYWLRELEKVDSPRIKQKKYRVYDIGKLQKFYQNHKFEPFTEWRRRGHYKDFPLWRPNSYRPVLQHSPTEIIDKK